MRKRLKLNSGHGFFPGFETSPILTMIEIIIPKSSFISHPHKKRLIRHIKFLPLTCASYKLSMKQNNFRSLLLIGLVGLFFASCDSKAGSSAAKDFEVEYTMEFDAGSSQMADGMKAMGIDLSTLGMKTYVSGYKTSVNMNMGMMKMDMVTNSTDKKAIMLLSAQGQKMSVDIGPDDFESFVEHQNKEYGEVTITDEVKEIAGYECKLAKVSSNGSELDIWYTDALFPGSDATGYNYGLDGFPLQMELKQGMLQMLIKAKAVTLGAPVAEHFDMTIPEGYKPLTLDQLSGM